MGTFDTVKGILDPYDDQFKCWDQHLNDYTVGDLVGCVGIAETYAILINSPEDVPPRFVWVKDRVLGATMAHQPIEGKPIFDKWGGYLGMGGDFVVKPTKKSGSAKIEQEDIELYPSEERLPPLPPPDDEGPTLAVTFEDVDPVPSGGRLWAKKEPSQFSQVVDWVTHVFWLRPGMQIKVSLPGDLSQREAERLALFVESLPFTSEPE
jgi:hypothetical protein